MPLLRASYQRKMRQCTGYLERSGQLLASKWINLGLQEMAPSRVQEIISSNRVVVFSKTNCVYCAEVKQLLSRLRAHFMVIELDMERDESEMQSALMVLTGQRTVPNVFIAGNHMGGCDAIMATYNQGQLVPLLTQAGALA